MLLDKYKRIIAAIIFAFVTVSVFAVDTSEYVKKNLTAAEDAMDDGDIDTAYKKINGALKLMKDANPSVQTSVVLSARTIYSTKLKDILQEYDGAILSEININLKDYPEIKNSQIEKLLAQIDEKQKAEAEAVVQKRHEEEQKSIKEQTAAIEKQHAAMEKQAESNAELAESMKAQTETQAELAESMKSQSEELAKSTQEITKSNQESQKIMQEGFKDLQGSMSDQAEALKESSKSQARSTKIMVFSIVGIALLILLIVLVVIVIARRSMKLQAERQEQYMQAFRLIAENTGNTNRIMLGGATDLYGQSAPLKLAGTSTWAPAAALPDVTFTPEDEEELKQLAVKCEEIGTKIDQITNRKNNSKNVSELVYKLSMQLGLSQGNSMLNFCAAMIYDAGFLGVDPAIWETETLTDEQKEEMHNHVNIAEKYLDFVPKKYWEVFDDASKKHHENMDGSGYPNGLKGDEIPQIARLIRVAETYVSMSSRRNYRQAMDKETAIEKLREQPGFYDSAVVDTLDQIV